MPDEKVKAAENERVHVSTLLSIDSPMVIWHTDLETLGLAGGGGGGGSTTSSPETSSGGGSTSTGTEETGASTSGGKPATAEYIATCDAAVHLADFGGTIVDGRWFGSATTVWADASAEVGQHIDGLAYVALYVNGVLVGPVVQP